MNTRFSNSECDQPKSSDNRTDPAHDQFVPGLLASVGCESLAADLADESTAPESSLAAHGVFVPEHYEPNYAYPLIVCVAPGFGSDGRLRRLMRMVSERNYFGVSLPVTDVDHAEQDLFETFLRLRRRYHLHTERVYLLGSGTGGTQALQIGLRQPDWFAGIAAISATWPETPRLLARYDDLRGKRVLLGIGAGDSAAVVADGLYMRQLLWGAGMHVTALAAPGGQHADRSLLREVDRWIMQAIEQPELVC